MPQKKSDRNRSKKFSKSHTVETTMQNTSLKLQLGSQYLCHSAFNAPNLPDALRTLSFTPHLHLVVDAQLKLLSEAEKAYELRLNIHAYGLEKIPDAGEELTPLYDAHIIYGGLYAIIGDASKAAQEQYLLQNAPSYLYPSIRTMLLNFIKEAGFGVATIQPIDFYELWNKRTEQQENSAA